MIAPEREELYIVSDDTMNDLMRDYGFAPDGSLPSKALRLQASRPADRWTFHLEAEFRPGHAPDWPDCFPKSPAGSCMVLLGYHQKRDRRCWEVAECPKCSRRDVSYYLAPTLKLIRAWQPVLRPRFSATLRA